MMPAARKHSPAITLCLSVLTVLLFATCALYTHSAQAQITSTARAELGDKRKAVAIGSEIYITPHTSKNLTARTVINRHINEMRGVRKNQDIIVLPPDSPPVWLVFSVTNNTNKQDWMLHFGSLPQGRYGVIKNAIVYNHSTEKTVTKTNPAAPDGIIGTHFSGPALPLKLRPGHTETFAIYLEPGNGIANTFSPRLVSHERYLKDIRYGYMATRLLMAFLLVMAFVFVGVAIIRSNITYLVFSGFYAAQLALFFILHNTFLLPFSLAGGFLAFLFMLLPFCALVATKLFLNVTAEEHTENMALFGASALALLSGLFRLFIPLGTGIFDDILLFLPTILAMGCIGYVGYHKTQQNAYGSVYFLGAWGIWLAGFFITSMALSGMIGANTITVNMYWMTMLAQAYLLIYAVINKIQMQNRELRNIRARESRAAQSMARLKQSKESADQARLLRVIERERELMAELREREMQRTAEMRAAKEAADEANRAKSAFLAVVSHEIRTPMTGIMGMVRLMKDTALNSQQHEYVEAVQNSGDTMLALLNDILDFEKIESGNMELEEIFFDVRNLAQGIITLMSGHAADKKISLRADVDDNTPPYLKGDPTRLRQVLLNLVNNALKFTSRGEVVIRVKARGVDPEMGVKGGDQEVYFAVSDTGIGISKQEQVTLFDPFTQADKSVSRKYGGTGLGLAICRRLVEAMGGKLAVESEEGEGSTFFFSVLMESSSASEDIEDAAPEAITKVPPMRILVVEDNEINRKVLDGFLSQGRHEITMADSGEKALEIIKAQKEPFDVIFMDVNLDGISGLETTEAIRGLDEKRAATPIIALSGNVSQDDIKGYFKVGMNGSLAKPINSEKLQAALARVHTGDFENTPDITPKAKPAAAPSQPPPQEKKVPDHGYVPQPPPAKKDEYVPQPPPSKQQEHAPQPPAQGDLLSEPEPQQPEPAQEPPSESKGGDESEFALPPAAARDSEVFDKNMLQTLLETLGADQMKELISGFDEKAEEIIAALNAASIAGDDKELRARGHEIKGMAANFGFIEMQKLGKAIEDAGKNGETSKAAAHVPLLPSAHERAKETFTRWIQKATEG